MDGLSPLLERFTLNARVFFAGTLCSVSSFEGQPGIGTIHVLRGGCLRVEQHGGARLEISEPSVLFYPRPYAHVFQVDLEAGAELVCAWIDFGAGLGNPVLRGLPEMILAPLARIPGIDTALISLFDEAFAKRPGRQAALNRLVEYILVLLLRYAMEMKSVSGSVLAGLADPRLSKALNAMHARPEHPWTLGELAIKAGLSRARFAAHFRATTGATPLDYLTDWRLSVARTLLGRGLSVKLIAPMVGYSSSVAFTRVFSRRVGVPPARWLTGQRAAATGS